MPRRTLVNATATDQAHALPDLMRDILRHADTSARLGPALEIASFLSRR